MYCSSSIGNFVGVESSKIWWIFVGKRTPLDTRVYMKKNQSSVTCVFPSLSQGFYLSLFEAIVWQIKSALLFTTYGTSKTHNLQKAQFSSKNVQSSSRKTMHTHTFILETTKFEHSIIQLACFVVVLVIHLAVKEVVSLYSPVRCTLSFGNCQFFSSWSLFSANWQHDFFVCNFRFNEKRIKGTGVIRLTLCLVLRMRV